MPFFKNKKMKPPNSMYKIYQYNFYTVKRGLPPDGPTTS